MHIKSQILCACGGTHVKRTGEPGKLRITRVKSKGRMRKRVEFTLGRGENKTYMWFNLV